MKKSLIIVHLLIGCLIIFVNLPSLEGDDDTFAQLVTSITGYDDLTIHRGDSWRVAQYTTTGGEVEFFVQSFDFVKIKGYSGFTNLGMIFDLSGMVVNVEILSSQDTRSYIRRLNRSGFLEQFKGYNATQDLVLITGASVSSQAINDIVVMVSTQMRNLIENNFEKGD